jgi:arylsulfatase A-like enzyme
MGGQPIFHDMWRDDTEVFEEPVYQTELLRREAVDFIRRQSVDQPFCLYLAFGAAHYPMMAPRRYVERFPASMDRDRRTHLAVVAAMDDAVGQVREAVEQRGLTRDTVVFFMSDNGATNETRADSLGRRYEGGSNKPWRAWKGSLFEGGMRVPALLAHPGTIQPRVENTTLAAMDLMPTLLRMAGAAVPEDVDGADLSGLLRNRTALAERVLFWDYSGQSAARSGHWKLLTSHREGLGHPVVKERWLSNLKTDPAETRNFIPEQPGITARLADAIATWRAKYP